MSKRSLLAPEVIQTSEMDCGPASLKCLLEGFGIKVGYGRLREACHTDVDGCSIDSLEDTAVLLGLEATQTMLPPEHLLLSEAVLPGLVITRLPNGGTHFVVVWRRHGPLLQVMDPAIGRRWVSTRRFLDDLYIHTFPVDADAWRSWAGSGAFTGPLRRRLAALSIGSQRGEQLIAAGCQDLDWEGLARLDAAIRVAERLTAAKSLRRGREAAELVERLTERSASPDLIPETLRFAAEETSGPDQEERVKLRGAVLVVFSGRRKETIDRTQLPVDLAAALDEPPTHSLREVARLLLTDGIRRPATLTAMAALTATGVVTEALLFRGLLSGPPGSNGSLLGAILVLSCGLLLLELGYVRLALGVGTHLEVALRRALLDKLPRLPDKYLRSRPIADLAQRSHSVHQLRLLPDLAAAALQSTIELVLVVGAITWLYPPAAPFALAAAVISVGLALAAQPLLAERDLRVRSHVGVMARFYLDALKGLMAIRAHSGEEAVRFEHDWLLRSWAAAQRRAWRAGLVLEAAQQLTGLALAISIVLRYSGEGANLLLLIFWALSLPVLGQRLGLLARLYPVQRNLLLRFLEPLLAPTEDLQGEKAPSAPASNPSDRSEVGLEVRLEAVTVVAGGHPVLQQLDLDLPAGSHVAVVGSSGAGKSTLLGLILGWHRPSSGQVRVDGAVLDEARLHWLYRQTTWLDPLVWIWNRSIEENLTYAALPSNGCLSFEELLSAASLEELVSGMPDGMKTALGDGGGLVSEGEAQRVRFGRALSRPNARLVLLDEPFRGLDRDERKRALRQCRERWQTATLVCVTHDVTETLDFERVLVLEGGQIVEDGNPNHLLERPQSRYRSLVEAALAAAPEAWAGTGWRRLELRQGRLLEAEAGEMRLS